MDEVIKGIAMIILGIILILVFLILFFGPTIIAFKRSHHYKWIIFGINLIFGATGIGYLVAFAWSVWPRQTSVVDLVKNDPTDNSLEACKQYYQKRGEIDKTYDYARYDGVRISHPQQVDPMGKATVDPVNVDANGNALLTKPCPFCGEDINMRAIKCKHCQSMLIE